MKFQTSNYDLATTLNSGQAFRWQSSGEGWTGVVGRHWVRLQADASSITAETASPVADWHWLTDYLQLDLSLDEVLSTFPDDEPMRAAVAACSGLRLLRQDPWECLASFVLSSTKQIVQIRRIVSNLCETFGEPVLGTPAQSRHYAFPSAARLAASSEADLRACRMGFRAPFLLEAARSVASGRLDLDALATLPLDSARDTLARLPGVGPKIADCVLLFAYGFPTAFPIDVWVMKALRQLYFPRRKVHPSRLRQFASTHFGPYAGYAQQYLFHYMRTWKSSSLLPTLTP